MQTIALNLLHYLADKGLIDKSAIVDGGIVVNLSRSRNQFVQIKIPNRLGFFLKQAIEQDAIANRTVAREAEIYRGALGDKRLKKLRALLPEMFLYDQDQRILVTELVADAENLTSLHRRLESPPEELAERLGHGLADYHSIRFVAGAPQAAIFPQQPPWILMLHEQPEAFALRRTATASAVLDMLLDAPQLGDYLGALKKTWACDTLIHTDIKWENVLLAPRNLRLPDQRLYIIDWELADIGDASWDTGSMLQSYLAFWINSMSDPQRTSSTEELVANASLPLPALQRAVAKFWRGYREGRKFADGEEGAFLTRSVQMAAARLFVSAFEMSLYAPEVHWHAALMVRMGLNILAQPEEAINDLFGLTSELSAEIA